LSIPGFVLLLFYLFDCLWSKNSLYYFTPVNLWCICSCTFHHGWCYVAKATEGRERPQAPAGYF